MAEQVEVKGFDEYKATVTNFEQDDEVNVYFTGSKNEENVSWCPDCAEAEPIVFEAVKEFAKEGSKFVIVDVGDRTFWKDMKNPFRLDKDTNISVVPSLIRWKSPKRLEGDQLTKKFLLEMFFSDDE